jgi:hypothetical protein
MEVDGITKAMVQEILGKWEEDLRNHHQITSQASTLEHATISFLFWQGMMHA